jgi:plastocyanin
MRTRFGRRSAVVLVGALGLVLVGCGSDGGDTTYVEPTGPAGKTIEVEGTNFKFDPDDLKAPSGVTEFVFTSGDNLHDLRIKGIAGFILEANGGETDSGKVELEPGTYEIYCSQPGHEAAGMKGTLTVT